MPKKKKNFKVNKSVMNFIHARDFWQEGDAEKFKTVIKNIDKWQPKEYGWEIPDFNMLDPELDMVFGEMLGDYVKVEDETCVFRLPYPIVHFESFNSLNEWRLAVALEDNVFKIYNHISGVKDARYGYEFDYQKEDDWIVETQMNLKQNDAVFYRPWTFHSFEFKPLHCYKIFIEE